MTDLHDDMQKTITTLRAELVAANVATSQRQEAINQYSATLNAALAREVDLRLTVAQQQREMEAAAVRFAEVLAAKEGK
jgi:hypothetical protein